MDVNEFMSVMNAKASSPIKRREKKESPIKKVALNFNGNFGRYNILPVNSNITDFPYVPLYGTRELCIERRYTDSQGTEKSYDLWIKILPKDAYMMKDATGKATSSLTSEEERLLLQATQLFDNLYTALDAKNNREIQSKQMRKRNYTLFYAYCLEKFGINDPRTTVESNFPALFYTTSKPFLKTVEDNILDTNAMRGNDNSWVSKVYNEAPERGGSVIFTVQENKATPGFDIRVNHAPQDMPKSNLVVPKEFFDLMVETDPVEFFLGNQARPGCEEDAATKRRTFNADLINEAIEEMTKRLASARLSSNAGTVENAQNVTNSGAQAFLASGSQTMDPMLGGSAADYQLFQASVDRVQANNNAPFVNPPVSHTDPIQGAPTFGGNSGNTEEFPF